MIICQIDNIENKYYKNSEGVITLGWKSRNDSFENVNSELRRKNYKSILCTISLRKQRNR